MSRLRASNAESTAWALPALAALLVILASAPIVEAQTSAHHPGRWSEGSNWTYTPIHLNLLRGRDSLHSQILWWQAHRPPHDQNPGFKGGLWGWRPKDTLNIPRGPIELVPGSEILLYLPTVVARRATRLRARRSRCIQIARTRLRAAPFSDSHFLVRRTFASTSSTCRAGASGRSRIVLLVLASTN